MKQSFDYIIVGGGTAGCVLAHRLTEDHSASVLVLEAGPAYRWYRHSPNVISYRYIRSHSWRFWTEPQPFCDGEPREWPMAKVMGGGSSTNAMLYTRGDAQCYNQWASSGCVGWDYSNVLPYFKKWESFDGGDSEYHGHDGPIPISFPRELSEFSKRFLTACDEIGIPRNPDFNGARYSGAGQYQATQRNGLRSSAAVGYLGKQKKKKNLTIITNALVTRILFDKERATGVEYRIADETKTAFSTKEIILSAGALNTPKLLMLSGLGPASLLEKVGIAVKIDLPGVGKNLQDHIRVPVRYRLKKPEISLAWYRLAWEVMKYVFRFPSLFSSPWFEVGALIGIESKDEMADCQLTVRELVSPEQLDICDFEPCLVGTQSVGQLELRSSDPTAPPLIDPKYLSDDRDLNILIGGVKLVREIARTKAFGEILKEEVTPGDSYSSNEKIATHIRKTLQTCFHPVGTCRMGIDNMAVVDPQLRVRGLQNIRIVDASIMPRIINGNTNGPTLMIAEKGADLIKSQ